MSDPSKRYMTRRELATLSYRARFPDFKIDTGEARDAVTA
jgi:hypothetical protein